MFRKYVDPNELKNIELKLKLSKETDINLLLNTR
jgi:hypothetical protein